METYIPKRPKLTVAVLMALVSLVGLAYSFFTGLTIATFGFAISVVAMLTYAYDNFILWQHAVILAKGALETREKLKEAQGIVHGFFSIGDTEQLRDEAQKFLGKVGGLPTKKHKGGKADEFLNL